MDKSSVAKDYKDLGPDDKDLTMFTITDLKLVKSNDQVHMVMLLKRKVQTEMLTTYLPTLLLLMITYATAFFSEIYFEAKCTLNLTIMLVMTTIFTSKIAELPPTSDTKMIDIWLILCQMVPFAEVVLLTAMEYNREEEGEQRTDLVFAKENSSLEDEESSQAGLNRLKNIVSNCKAPNLKTIGGL